MKIVNVREKQTNWKELFRAFFSSDEQIEKTDSGLNKYMNDPQHIKDFGVASESIKSLEDMLRHSDKKPRRRAPRKAERLKTRKPNVVSKAKTLDEREQDLER